MGLSLEQIKDINPRPSLVKWFQENAVWDLRTDLIRIDQDDYEESLYVIVRLTHPNLQRRLILLSANQAAFNYEKDHPDDQEFVRGWKKVRRRYYDDKIGLGKIRDSFYAPGAVGPGIDLLNFLVDGVVAIRGVLDFYAAYYALRNLSSKRHEDRKQIILEAIRLLEEK